MDRFKLDEWPLHGIFFACLLGGLYYLYSLGFRAPWFFDDAHALSGVANVNSLKAGLDYIISGNSGLLGRPISSATFLFNIKDWPNHPEGFRIIGTRFHLLNGLLVCITAYQIARLLPKHQDQAALFASMLFGLWMLHPIHFSATLMPVQRMTLVSATFVLLGLLGYVIGRKKLETEDWRKGLLWCTLSLSLCTLVAVLAKENGGLLPFFVALLELILFKQHRPQVQVPAHLWKTWQRLFFLGPMVLLAAYLLYLSPGFAEGYASKPFSLTERLATQTVILWDYLRLIIIPFPGDFGPYHDDYSIYGLQSAPTFMATLAWSTAWILAIKFRKTHPWPLFAIAWFHVGHLLESTLVPLELYFEHRNYLPSLGPIAITLGYILQWAHSGHFSLWTQRIMGYILLLIMMGLLWTTTSLWQDTLEATEQMTDRHPLSVRAAQQWATEAQKRNDFSKSIEIIEAAAERIPFSSSLQATRLQIRCASGNPQSIQAAYNHTLTQAEKMLGSNALVPILHKISLMVTHRQCGPLTLANIHALIQAFSQNTKIERNAAINYKLDFLAGDLYLQTAQKNEALAAFKRSMAHRKTPLNIMRATAVIAELETPARAIEFLDSEIPTLPVEDLRVKSAWGPQVEALRAELSGKIQ